MAERQISLKGVPEPIARAIEVLAQTARKLAAEGEKETPPKKELPVWNLGIKGVLRREDFYGDAK